MELSARNQLPGTIKAINKGGVVSEIVLDVSGHEVASVITTSSAERLKLKVGDQVNAVIKATEVMISR